ncbi:MAG: FeoB-associated Cys-rich membrane protein [Clostridia bacterium]|nr:FeoB-associated Cys-rich membrane protein [Clostridia bacterium]
MKLGDYVILGIVTMIVVAVITYIIRQKKKGVKCIGCPHGKSCSNCNCKNK